MARSTTVMSILFVIALLAPAAQADDTEQTTWVGPDAVQQCFVEHGNDWVSHHPPTPAVCHEHCEVMCGGCFEVVAANAGDLLAPFPKPPKGWDAFMSCLCEDTWALANTIGPGGKQDRAALGMILMACAASDVTPSRLELDSAAKALGLVVPEQAAGGPNRLSSSAFLIATLGMAAFTVGAALLASRRGAVQTGAQVPQPILM